MIATTFVMAIGVAAWAGSSAQQKEKQADCSKTAACDPSACDPSTCDESTTACCNWDDCPLK